MMQPQIDSNMSAAFDPAFNAEIALYQKQQQELAEKLRQQEELLALVQSYEQSQQATS